MHEHDQDIIMALAEGTLAAETAAAAEAEISACSTCRRDLELQRMAVAVLDDTPRAYLTAVESARLHERLHQELSVTTLRAAPSPRRQGAISRQGWGRWIGAAAGAAAVFVALFLILPSLGGLGGDDDASTEMVAMDGATETTASPEIASAPQMREEFAADADDLAGVEGGGAAETTAAASSATTTTAAGFSTEDPAADSANFLTWFVSGDLNEQLRLEVIEQLDFDREYLGFADETLKGINPDWAVCVDSIIDSDLFADATEAQIVGVIVAESGEDAGMERLLVAFLESELEDTTLASITIPECEVFETLP